MVAGLYKKPGKRKLKTQIALILLLLTVFTGAATAATIYVPDNYPTIQQAVDHANPHDTIIVRDGIYNERVSVTKVYLTIKSENGSANCIVDGEGSGSVFTLHSDGIRIEGFTVRNAGYSWREAEIKIPHHNYYTVDDITVVGNVISGGYSGVFIESNTRNIIIIGNSISDNYYGVYIVSSRHNSIINNNISSNSQGIYLQSNNNNVIGNNISLNNKWGIYVWYSNYNNISKNTILNNDCGIWGYYSNNNTIDGNSILNNGGSISFGSGKYNKITDNNISSNQYGIYLSYSSDNNIISGNNIVSNERYGVCLSDSKDNVIMVFHQYPI